MNFFAQWQSVTTTCKKRKKEKRKHVIFCLILDFAKSKSVHQRQILSPFILTRTVRFIKPHPSCTRLLSQVEPWLNGMAWPHITNEHKDEYKSSLLLPHVYQHLLTTSWSDNTPSMDRNGRSEQRLTLFTFVIKQPSKMPSAEPENRSSLFA